MAVFRRILVGTDGSVTAGRAVDRAATLASALDATLLIAYVGEAGVGADILEAARSRHGDAGVEIATHALAGDPADALLGLAGAEHVDLVVVGSKGMTGAQRFLLGSVPNKVSHRADCDVLIVHTTTDGEDTES